MKLHRTAARGTRDREALESVKPWNGSRKGERLEAAREIDAARRLATCRPPCQRGSTWSSTSMSSTSSARWPEV